MGCNLTKICNVTKNGGNDGKLEWNIILNEDYLNDSNNQYCYKVYKIDVSGEPIEVSSGELTQANVIDSNIDMAKIVVEELPAGHFKLDVFIKENGQVVDDDNYDDYDDILQLLSSKLLASNCSGYVREPEKLQMIISNNKQNCYCTSNADLTIIGGVTPYTVLVNNVNVSESYSSICLFNCKVNKIKVTDANGCVICKKL